MEAYSRGSKFFHWTIALLVTGMLSVTFFLDQLFAKENIKTAFMVHKSLGLTILVLMIARIFWIIKTGRPALPQSVKYWERFLARLVQYCLYLLLILMPLSGWIMSVAKNRAPVFFNLFTVPFPGIPLSDNLAEFMAGWHNRFAWMLIVLLALHISAALKHHFINKNNVLRTMLPSRNASK